MVKTLFDKLPLDILGLLIDYIPFEFHQELIQLRRLFYSLSKVSIIHSNSIRFVAIRELRPYSNLERIDIEIFTDRDLCQLIKHQSKLRYFKIDMYRYSINTRGHDIGDLLKYASGRICQITIDRQDYIYEQEYYTSNPYINTQMCEIATKCGYQIYVGINSFVFIPQSLKIRFTPSEFKKVKDNIRVISPDLARRFDNLCPTDINSSIANAFPDDIQTYSISNGFSANDDWSPEQVIELNNLAFDIGHISPLLKGKNN